MEMCSLVFYKTFFGFELSFFSKSNGCILEKLRVSFVKNESESNGIIVSNYVITYEKNEALAWLLLMPLHIYTCLYKIF